MKLNDQILINNKVCKNRIVMPPLVCFNWADDDGIETVSRAEHYGQRAEHDTGLIVVEASAISKDSRLADSMLGIWDDKHIPQFESIAKACHQHNSLVLVQLLHAGYKSTGRKVSASTLEANESIALTLEEITNIKTEFVQAAKRAYQAGLDGVEVHGAHSYLLNQFTSSQTNLRTDLYGGSLENRMRLPLEVIEAIREETSDDFIIGYRFGLNDPTFEEDLTALKLLDKAGVDFHNVSVGYSSLDIQIPEDFKHHPITYMGKVINDHTSKPVACVYGIRNGDQAKDLVENHNMKMVAVGKGLLADPKWSMHALNKTEYSPCLECKRCLFIIDGHKCPAKKSED